MARAHPARRERRRVRLTEQRTPAPARPSQRWIAWALGAAFLLSGAAGLVHEVVWSRLLGLVFGATALAISTVLAAYMGGLALGSYLIGRRADRLTDGRRAYALLEVGIGASALAVPVLLTLVEPVYGWVWRQTHASFTTFSVLRLLLAGTILIGPTLLMGATLPVLAHYCAGLQHRRVPPQWLYTVNLFGAVLGVAATPFLLLPAFGVWGTVVAGAALNIAVGLGVLALPRVGAPARSHALGPTPAVAAGEPPRLHLLVWLAALCSGFLAMTTQVAWTRVLSLIVGSTTYAFSSVLIVYLVALGVGSAFASRRGARVPHVGPDLSLAHALFAVTMLGTLYTVNRLPYWYLQLSDVWSPTTLGGVVGLQLLILCSVLVVPVLSAGAILPLAIVAAAPAGTRDTGPAVGRVYAVNTLGAIAGALVGGFILVPRLGSELTLLGVCLIAAVLACAFALWLARSRRLLAAALASLVIVGLGLVRRPGWNFNELHSGVFEPGRIKWDPALPLTQEGEEVLYQREGPTASVLVGQRPSGFRNLVINARVNASDSPTDMATQVMLAQLPLLLAPHVPRDVFILGWGSGVTVGSTLLWPTTRVTAVEIEPAVVEGSRFFEHVNNHPFRHTDRLQLYEDDARHILVADETTYDVIISEPSHPWVSGVANLFTRDFYRIVERRLRPDGLFVQWLQTYQISPESFRSVVAALQSVIPEVLVFRPPDSFDSILIASRDPLRLDLDALARRWKAKPVRADLLRVAIGSPEDVLATFYLGPRVVRALGSGKAVANTDDNMYVELRGPREFVQTTESAVTIVGLLKRLVTPVEELLADPAALLARRDRLAAYVASLEGQGRATAPYDERLRALP